MSSDPACDIAEFVISRSFDAPRELAWQAQRIVFLLSFSDACGEEDRTAVTIQSAPRRATEEERRTFALGRESMRLGFTGMLETHCVSSRGADTGAIAIAEGSSMNTHPLSASALK